MSLSKKNPSLHQEITCPFCSLLCDDLVLQNNNGRIKVKENGCAKAITQFEQPNTETSPKIKGKRVSIDDAISHACNLLKQSKQPLLAGLGTDVSGMRAVMQLADKTGAIVDHMHSEGAMRNVKVLQDHGWMMTTMAEIKNRADLIVFAGTNGVDNYPRLFERIIWNKNSLFNVKKREIIYIGHQIDTKSVKYPAGNKPTLLECKQEQIGEIISSLHALIVGNQLQQTSIAGIKLSILESLATRMKSAKYGVIIWAPGELNFPYAELTIQAISGVIKYLNRSTRFAGFTLGGNDGGVSSTSVSTWQSGYPLRVNFSKGFPEYDPYKYSANNVLKRKEVDSLLWISSFNPDIVPPKAKIPSIILTTPYTKISYKPDVYIPVGTPGVDHKGHLFRTDNIISLPLKQIRESKFLSVKEVLNRLINSL